MERSILIVLACFAASTQTISLPINNPATRLPSAIVRERSPEEVLRLPTQIRNDLTTKHCKLPAYEGPYGLTSAFSSGNFHDRTAVDWAVVCHIPNSSGEHILQRVFVYSPAPKGWKSEQLTPSFGGTEPEGQDCEESITAASPNDIRNYNETLAGGHEQLPPLSHDGVEVGYCEKASDIYFYRAGHWLILQGSD
jgi:hypothetical protein